MEPSVYGLILLIVVILIGSACCSGVEAAFLAVNSIRILEIASKQKPKSTANQLLKLRKHLGRTLTVITITNNGFNIIGSLILGVYGAMGLNVIFNCFLHISCSCWRSSSESSRYKIFSSNSFIICSYLENIKYLNETIFNINRTNISCYYCRK